MCFLASGNPLPHRDLQKGYGYSKDEDASEVLSVDVEAEDPYQVFLDESFLLGVEWKDLSTR